MTFMSAVGTHLWQSTLFAVIVGVATLALRRNHAAIRHALWLAASIKFLVPFAALTALGAELGPRLPVKVTRTEILLVMNGAQPELPAVAPLALPPAQPGVPAVPPAALGAIWLCGA